MAELERGGKDYERIAVAVRDYLDPVTGRLRPEDCAMVFQRFAASFDMGWAAVALRIPVGLRPTAAEWVEYRKRRGTVRAVCPACDDPRCADCRRLAEELGEFTAKELADMIAVATAIGGLSYADIQREQRRRIMRCLP